MNRQNILELREQIQEDLITYLDGMKDETLTEVCQIVVNNCNNLLKKLDEDRSSH